MAATEDAKQSEIRKGVEIKNHCAGFLITHFQLLL